MKYNNEEMLIKVEEIAKRIMPVSTEGNREVFFPKLIDALGYKNAVEIGVDKGVFTKCLLEHSRLETVYGIDPWIDNFGSNYRPGFFDPNGENRMATALDNLKEFGKRAMLIKNTSVEAAKICSDNTIDFVYIDGDHSLEGVYLDVYTWIHKLRKGGMMCGDDFKDGPNSGMQDFFGNQLPFRVKTVVEFFCAKYGFKLNTFGKRVPNWWFIKNY